MMNRMSWKSPAPRPRRRMLGATLLAALGLVVSPPAEAWGQTPARAGSAWEGAVGEPAWLPETGLGGASALAPSRAQDDTPSASAAPRRLAPAPLEIEPAAGDPRDPLFTRRDLGFAAAFALGTLALAPVDLAIAEAMQDSVIQADAVLRGGAGVFRWLGFPGVAVISGGLYVAGVATGHREAADIGLHTTGAIVAAELVTIAAKGVVGRARPHLDTGDPYDFDLLRGITHDDYQSFPSGHTTAAFAAAAALTTEISRHHPEAKWWVGTIMFGGATLMGVSRLYHNEHWASDVAAGAAVGSFGGWKIVRYMHQRPENRIDRWLLPAAAPAPGGGVTVTWSIAPPR